MDTLMYRQYAVKIEDMKEFLKGSLIDNKDNKRILLKSGIICNISKVIISNYIDTDIYLVDLVDKDNKYIIIKGDTKYYYTKINVNTYNILSKTSNAKASKEVYTFITKKGFKCSYVEGNLMVDVLSNLEERELKSEIGIDLICKDIEYIRGITVGLLLKIFNLYIADIVSDNISGIVYYKDRKVYYNEIPIRDNKDEVTLNDIITAEVRVGTFINDAKSVRGIAQMLLEGIRGYLNVSK